MFIKRLIKNENDLVKCKEDFDLMWFSKPDQFPCIAIKYLKDVSVNWSEKGFTLDRSFTVDYIYPKLVQQELYNEDFEKLTK